MCGSTKNKISAVAEQIPQAPAEADFVGLIKYISEREKGLSRYSDKLRQSLVAIDQHLQNMHISINVQDKEPFAEDDAQGDPLQLYLYLGEGPRGFGGLWVYAAGYGSAFYGYKAFGDVKRLTLLQLVRSGRLPKFLALVAQNLAEAEAEYSEVATIAQKMAKAIENSDIAEHKRYSQA